MKPGTRTNQLKHQFRIIGTNALYDVIHGKLDHDTAMDTLQDLRTLWTGNPSKDQVAKKLGSHLENTDLTYYGYQT